MPRQIIDTESSRPAYVRRRTRRIIVWLTLLILLIAAIWFLAQHRALAQESRGPGGTAPLVFLRQAQDDIGACAKRSPERGA